jgi:hypothetical protein
VIYKTIEIYFSEFLEAGESEIKVPTDSVFDEGFVLVD